MTKLNPPRRNGFSLIELLVVITIILIILGMAIPRIQEGRESALRTAAIQAIKTIHTAQAQYQSQYERFATTLSELGPGSNAAPSASAANLIDPDLAAGRRGGYEFELHS